MRKETVSSRASWIGGMLGLLLFVAPLSAEVPDEILRQRYHAILSAGEALVVSGEILRDQREMIEALTAAWIAGDRALVLSLLEQAELRFGAAEGAFLAPAGAILRIVVDPEGAILDGPVSTRALRASLFEIRRDVWTCDPFLTEELALHDRLRRDSPPALIVVAFGPPDPNPEGFVPPRGWTERAMLIERWRRIADIARPGLAPPIILDGSLAPDRPGFRSWMATERRARPHGPFLVRNLDPGRPELLGAAPADHWIVEPDADGRSLFETLLLFPRLRVARLDLLAPPHLPWFDLLKGFFEGSGGSLHLLDFEGLRIAALQSGREIFFLNEEARTVRIEIVMIPGPIDGGIALLYEEGRRPEISRIRRGAAIEAVLPPGVVVLVRIGEDD